MLKGIGVFTAAAIYLFLGAIIVLVVTHANGFAAAVSGVGGEVNKFANLITGNIPAGQFSLGPPQPSGGGGGGASPGCPKGTFRDPIFGQCIPQPFGGV